MTEYKIIVEKDYLVFASGHFITYTDTCESLHGHNYRARVELEGDLDVTGYVWDFVTLKRTMRKLVDELDHRVLLPLESPALKLQQTADSIEVLYRERRYVFPIADVVLLPIPNTTAENLARFLLQRLRQELRAAGGGRLKTLSVEVEESFGQSAVCREAFGADPRP